MAAREYPHGRRQRDTACLSFSDRSSAPTIVAHLSIQANCQRVGSILAPALLVCPLSPSTLNPSMLCHRYNDCANSLFHRMLSLQKSVTQNAITDAIRNGVLFLTNAPRAPCLAILVLQGQLELAPASHGHPRHDRPPCPAVYTKHFYRISYPTVRVSRAVPRLRAPCRKGLWWPYQGRGHVRNPLTPAAIREATPTFVAWSTSLRFSRGKVGCKLRLLASSRLPRPTWCLCLGPEQ